MTPQEQDAFVRRWKAFVTGTIVLGHVKVEKTLKARMLEAEAVGAVYNDAGDTAEELIRKLLADALKHQSNGKPADQPQTRSKT